MVEEVEEEAVKNDYHAANDELNKQMLLQLAQRCDDAEVAAVLSCYSIGAVGADIRKEMIKAKLPHLAKTAVFLGVPNIADIQKSKAKLVTNIMKKLNTLLMDLCGVCGDYYSVDLQDKPAFSCITCGQGCHDKCFDPVSTLFRGLDATYRKAMQFVCSTCYSDHKPDDEEVVVNAKKSPIKAKTPTHEEELEEEVEVETKTPEPVPSKAEEKKQTTDTSNVNFPRQDRQQPNPAETHPKKPMCPQYEHQIRCENYEVCKAVYFHPRRCRNLLTFGKCRFGQRCRYHHPKICPKSLSEKKCTNLDCKLFHIKYTVRYNHLSAAVEEEGRPPWHPHPPAQPRTQHQPVPPGQQHPPRHQLHQGDENRNPTSLQENGFLFQHITESNNTMKQLQSLINNLINAQKATQPQENHNIGQTEQPPIQQPQPQQLQLQPQHNLVAPLNQNQHIVLLPQHQQLPQPPQHTNLPHLPRY